MSVLVRFYENKNVDSDVDVIGRAVDGEHKGKICFLTNRISDPFQYTDQEVYCEIVHENERSLVVHPQGASGGGSSNLGQGGSKPKYNADSIFNI